MYLTTDCACAILAKNKIKKNLETGNRHFININMQESIYDFLLAQQNETKKIMEFETDLSDDFDFYLNEIIAPITNNKDDIDTNSTTKFLFYHFNNLRLNLNKDTY